MSDEIYKDKPDAYFVGNDATLIIHEPKWKPSLSGLCIDYECGSCRYDVFADYIMDWLPEYALRYSEYAKIRGHNARRIVKEAARRVYTTDKYQNRGEFGEIILHALLREICKSEPVISKIYFEDSCNNTAKGFDAVHIVKCDDVINDDDDNLELWLGEVKFYTDYSAAVREVIGELKDHSQKKYLRDEFMLVTPKIDDKWKYAEKVRQLINCRNSLDNVFKRVCFPILLTYESETLEEYAKFKDEIVARMKEEITKQYSVFIDKLEKSGFQYRIHLFLFPLESKKALIDEFDQKLKGSQR